jgi:hypothetical protein
MPGEANMSGGKLTQEDLRRLPFRGIVAFAARCARRAQPVFDEWNTGHSPDYRPAVENAIAVAEEFARGDRSPSETVALADRASKAADRASYAAKATDASDAALAAEVAAAAALAACNAVDFDHGLAPDDEVALASATVRLVHDAVSHLLGAFPAAERQAVIDSAAHDLEKLVRLNLGSYPDLGHPVRSVA